MFKKISPNYQPSPTGGVLVSRVIPVESAPNSTLLVRDNDVRFTKDFPPPEVFEIEAQMKAGVPLKEVNTVVFDNQTLDDNLKTAIDKKVTKKVEPTNE